MPYELTVIGIITITTTSNNNEFPTIESTHESLRDKLNRKNEKKN